MILIITKLQDKFVDSFKQGSGRLKSAFSLANCDIYLIGTYSNSDSLKYTNGSVIAVYHNTLSLNLYQLVIVILIVMKVIVVVDDADVPKWIIVGKAFPFAFNCTPN